ncbi:PD-(D/E)XK nuclease family protein [Alteribacter populi]|uniref:PD-(D/E)XK nuclease family protein n=1 Tax=Alteribacter populi TaxID=2011011 RepID=UPI000BBAD8C9|nr:PD-(D/E)XK nuclease family protein [Alteribacter populi]
MSPEFLASLKQIVKKHPLEEKVFVVPSKRDGRLASQALAKSSVSVVNVHSKTIDDLAKDCTQWQLVREGKNELPHEAGRQLIHQLMKDMQAKNEFLYFTTVKLNPALSEAVYRAIIDIKMAGVDLAELNPALFQKKEKGIDLLTIFKRYEEIRQARGLFDRADLISIAIDSGEKAKRSQVFVLFPHDAYHPIISAFLSEFTESATVYTPNFSQIKYVEQNKQLLVNEEIQETETLESKVKSEQNKIDLNVSFSPEEELNHVLSCLKKHNIPLDQAVIQYPTGNPYRNLLYQLRSKESVPMTFSEGIPLFYQPSGKALLAYLEWMKSDFHIQGLEKIINERLLIEPEGVSVPQALKKLKKLGVNQGVTAYKNAIEELEKKGEMPQFSKWLQSLLAVLPFNYRFETVLYSEFLQSIASFLQIWVRPTQSEDESAKAHVLATIDQLKPFVDGEMKSMDAVGNAEYWFSQMQVVSSMPKPGHLHVTPTRTGLYYDYNYVFVVGMSNQNVPGSHKEDPVLLDEERVNIHKDMMTSKEHMKRASWKTANLIGTLQGKRIYSYPYMDITNNRKSAPAYGFIQLYRWTTGHSDATGEEVETTLAANLTFINKDSQAINRKSWWVHQLWENKCLEKPFYEKEIFQHLLQGREARHARSGDQFTNYDGLIGYTSDHFDPRENSQVVMSASKLENLATCPYRYFLKDVLEIEPEEDDEEDRYRWLDPATKGTLLHGIFERFYQELYDQGKTAELAGGLEWITQIAEEGLAQTKKLLPPPNEVIYELESQEILDACFIFLKLEEEFTIDRKPIGFEYAFGFRGQESISIPLKEGKNMRLMGKIDRVDQLSDGSFGMVDYKSGSDFGYDEDTFFNGGRKLQHSLYALAFEMLNETETKRVSESHYLFPTKKGEGKKVSRPFNEQRKEELLKVVDHLCSMIKMGEFPFTDDENDCKFCDFKAVCMRHGYDESHVQTKIAKDTTTGTRLLREVRQFD